MPRTPQPQLIVFGGRPGTGKTTISRALAKKLGAFYLRIDTIEQAAQAAGAEKIGSAGYEVANAIAEDNLKLGFSVIADCVNPVAASRQAWRTLAIRSSALLSEICLVCSDQAEHRRRVEDANRISPGNSSLTGMRWFCTSLSPGPMGVSWPWTPPACPSRSR